MGKRMDLKRRIESILLYGGISKEDYHQVKGSVAADNRRSVFAWSICAALFWIMSLLMSLSSEAYALCRSVYIVALVICIITMLCAHFVTKDVPRILIPVMYLLKMSILGAGIGIAICQPDVRTASMIAFAIIIPVSLIDRPISNVILQTLTIIGYEILAKNIIEQDIYSWGLTNLIIFSVAGLLIGYVINKARYQRFIYAESAKRLAEIQTRYAYYDQMTGLKNRRAFAETIQTLENEMTQNCSVVMIDINGLKQTNDNCGHEAGDELIISTAECIRASFPETEDIFRLGGDEFCVIITAGEETIRDCLASLERVTAAHQGQLVNSISVAYGIASVRESADIGSAVKAADAKMYEAKRNYYIKSSNDRRKR